MNAIEQTITYNLVKDEARQLSWKLQNTIYVIKKGNTLYTSMSKEDGIVLTSFNFGNEITAIN